MAAEVLGEDSSDGDAANGAQADVVVHGTPDLRARSGAISPDWAPFGIREIGKPVQRADIEGEQKYRRKLAYLMELARNGSLETMAMMEANISTAQLRRFRDDPEFRDAEQFARNCHNDLLRKEALDRRANSQIFLSLLKTLPEYNNQTTRLQVTGDVNHHHGVDRMTDDQRAELHAAERKRMAIESD